MSLFVTENESGLYVAERSSDYHAVAALLRGHDQRLRLVPQWDEARRCMLWQVYSYNGPDRESEYVCSWQTAGGEPLPLSSRLLEKVQQLDLRTRGAAPLPNVLNEKNRERVAKDRDSKLGAVADDHRPYVDRGRVSVSLNGLEKA